MSFIVKLLIGGAGWALGGPIGAIIGVMAAGALESAFEGKNTAVTTTRKTTVFDFKMALLVLIAAVMKADGRVVKSELQVVKQFLTNTFGGTQAQEALLLLRDILKKDFDVEPVAVQVGKNLNYSSRMELLHMLIQVAGADGDLSEVEQRLLQQIAQLMAVSRADFQSVLAMYAKQEDKNWAYKVLEIEPTATNEEVKKAYRRMAMKFHPDKVNTLGEEVKRSATEKFKKINDAYQSIKRERNIE